MKMMKTKHFRMWAVFLAMIAPAVYLFGSLFSALTGAHGQEVFAEPVYVDEYVEVDSLSSDVKKIDVIDGDGWLRWQMANLPYGSYTFDFTLNNAEYNNIWMGLGGSDDIYWIMTGSVRLARYVSATDTLELTGAPFVFYSDAFDTRMFNDSVSQYLKYYIVQSVPSDVVVESAGAYSDYIFKNFFAKDNFLVEWGENAISGNPIGFAPFGAFWRYLDTNVLHLSNDQIGLMGYGYMYYASHVLLFDIAFILVTFFLDFIQKVNDKVVGGVD